MERKCWRHSFDAYTCNWKCAFVGAKEGICPLLDSKCLPLGFERNLFM